MYSLDLPAELVADLRETARAATVSAARTFGLGGSVWEVLRATGTGAAARTLPTSGPTAVAYIFRRRPTRAGETAAGATVGAAPWGIVLVSGDVRPRDRLVSRQDSRLQTTVQALEPWYEYSQGDVSPLPHLAPAPATTATYPAGMRVGALFSLTYAKDVPYGG